MGEMLKMLLDFCESRVGISKFRNVALTILFWACDHYKSTINFHNKGVFNYLEPLIVRELKS